MVYCSLEFLLQKIIVKMVLTVIGKKHISIYFVCFNIIYTRIILSKLKKSELRKLVSDYMLLKIKAKKHDVSIQLKEAERRYFHETGRNIFEDMS